MMKNEVMNENLRNLRVFRSSLERRAGRSGAESYLWYPAFPCASAGYFPTISEESIYRSNARVVDGAFSDAGLMGGSSPVVTLDSPGCYEILRGTALTVSALRVALDFELDSEHYPVLDDDDYAEMESDLVEEGIADYFGDDLRGVLRACAAFSGLFLGSSDVAIDDAAVSVLASFTRRVAFDCVAYSGELYIHDTGDLLDFVSCSSGWSTVGEIAASVLADADSIRSGSVS